MRMADAVLKVSPKAKPVYLNALNDNEQRFKDSAIVTPLRRVNFLSQVMTETGGCTVLQESGSYSAKRIMEIFGVGKHTAAITSAEAARLAQNGPALFERVYGLGNPRKAKELGNTQAGDGWNFRGIGPLQSTGRGNARTWGQRCGVNFEANVLLMVDPRYIMLPPLFYWDRSNLNDAADRDDMRAIRKAINGGYNGIEHVDAWHGKLWPLLRDGDAPAFAVAAPTRSTADMQAALNVLGYTPKLVEDGRYGPNTRKAVRWFQEISGIKVDGAAGPITMAYIAKALDNRHIPDMDVAA